MTDTACWTTSKYAVVGREVGYSTKIWKGDGRPYTYMAMRQETPTEWRTVERVLSGTQGKTLHFTDGTCKSMGHATRLWVRKGSADERNR